MCIRDRLENVVKSLGAHPDAGVTDQHAHALALVRFGSRALVRVNIEVARVDGKRASFGHGVTGIYRKVHEHLLHLSRINEYRPEIVGERRDQFNVCLLYTSRCV